MDPDNTDTFVMVDYNFWQIALCILAVGYVMKHVANAVSWWSHYKQPVTETTTWKSWG